MEGVSTFEARNLTRLTMQFCALRSCDLVRVTDSRGVLCCLIVRFVVGRKCSCGSFLQGSGLDRVPRYSAGNHYVAAFSPPRKAAGPHPALFLPISCQQIPQLIAQAAFPHRKSQVPGASVIRHRFTFLSFSLFLPKLIRLCGQRVMTYAGFEFCLTMFVLTTDDAG